ncbi:MAG: nicotinate phosphoribosyltransferase [Planctomycetes bacterium]|nr:nicotinate phosphoribosyltransferase [Planctomycetota bacterium]
MSALAPPPLLNDLYQFTMAEGYLRSGLADRLAVFDLFFRRAPFGGAFAIAAGIEEALDLLETLKFSPEDLDYLRSLRLFSPELLERLENFRFRGSAAAAPEGTPIFPGEPFLRVTAPLLEAQLVETLLLNTIGFASLIATKAARLSLAASGKELIEFGCRRAQGPNGALAASYYAFLGGCASTSNLEAGKRFGIPVRGTMAHSWVLAFPSETEAFRAYARTYPRSSIFLVDTFDTLKSGLPNALEVAREMRAGGHELLGIRLDSGDFLELAHESRRRLDGAGFAGVKILASGDLDEFQVERLVRAGAPIDAFGVGTRLVVGAGDPALNAAYKLSAVIKPSAGLLEALFEPRLKRTDDRAKATLPGLKEVYRWIDAAGLCRGDLIALAESPSTLGAGEDRPESWPRPEGISGGNWIPLLKTLLRHGKRLEPRRPLVEIRESVRKKIEQVPECYRRFHNPTCYPVALSPALSQMRDLFLSQMS